MRVAAITRKWLVRSFSFITVLVILMIVIGSWGARVFYYNTAESALRSGYNGIVARYFHQENSVSDERFNEIARSYTEAFTLKDTLSVWVIDRHGDVVSTSTGFPVGRNTEMPDYQQALSRKDGRSFWTGRTETGEKVMAMTVLLTSDAEDLSAVRYMVSMQQMDAQLHKVSLIFVLFGVAAILLTLIPGTVFIDRLVQAIRNTTKAADKIAKGDYDTHIDYRKKDEIGELCDAVHHMAAEIGTAEQLKNDFISTVSHELRTPLTAIQGWGETIRDVGTEDAALTERGVDVILSETKRLGGMVEELLDFSRIQSGRMTLREERMDIFAELYDTVFAFQEKANREKKKLHAEIPEQPIAFLGDPDRIRQVFLNILDNALKYTNEGDEIFVTAKADDSHVVVRVRDTGKGISESDLPHVKEKFYKADTTVRGSGIGLAVVDEIVRLHGGTFDIESVLGTGTTVTIDLPVQKQDERSIQNA